MRYFRRAGRTSVPATIQVAAPFHLSYAKSRCNEQVGNATLTQPSATRFSPMGEKQGRTGNGIFLRFSLASSPRCQTPAEVLKKPQDYGYLRTKFEHRRLQEKEKRPDTTPFLFRTTHLNFLLESLLPTSKAYHSLLFWLVTSCGYNVGTRAPQLNRLFHNLRLKSERLASSTKVGAPACVCPSSNPFQNPRNLRCMRGQRAFGPKDVMGAGDFLIHRPLRRATLDDLFQRPAAGDQSVMLGNR